jgi:hypothetical protein
VLASHVEFLCLTKAQSVKWLLETCSWIYDLSSLWVIAALKIDHKQVIDTALLFNNSASRTLPTLITLCKVS